MDQASWVEAHVLALESFDFDKGRLLDITSIIGVFYTNSVCSGVRRQQRPVRSPGLARCCSSRSFSRSRSSTGADSELEALTALFARLDLPVLPTRRSPSLRGARRHPVGLVATTGHYGLAIDTRRLADETGTMLWSRHRFRTDVADLEALWSRLPGDVDEVMVVMEPTRNAWVPLAAWFRRRGAVVVIVTSEQSSDQRDYLSRHTKTDRLDAELLARLPVLHPEGLHLAESLGPGEPLKRAVKIRAGLVHRRSAAMHRLDSLLEILGPGWTDALGTRMTQTTFKFLAAYANPHQVKRLGRARLARWFQHHTRKAWGPERAAAVVAAAEATIALWGNDGLDFEALAADIAAEACIALEVSEQIALLDRRIRDLYTEADPDGIVLSVPGVGEILAGQILGRVGDPHRFTNLASARSFSGLVPRRNSSGLTNHSGGPTKRGDACLRSALFQAADAARKVDPQIRGPLPAAHERHRPSPQLGDLHDRRRAAHAHRVLSAKRHSLRAPRRRRDTHHRRARPSHRHRSLPDPRRGPRCSPNDFEDRRRHAAGRAGQERSRRTLRDTARPDTSMNVPAILDNG